MRGLIGGVVLAVCVAAMALFLTGFVCTGLSDVLQDAPACVQALELIQRLKDAIFPGG